MSIKSAFLVACPAVALAMAGCSSTPSAETSSASPALKAPLLNSAGATIGEVSLIEESGGVKLLVQARDLPPGVHGFHVHMTGQCATPDFVSAGGHWNPGQHQHGSRNPKGQHAGDLPNLTVAADGTVNFSKDLTGVKLTEGPAPVLDADGAAIVIHAAPDDEMTDPTGNSGARIACAAFPAR